MFYQSLAGIWFVGHFFLSKRSYWHFQNAQHSKQCCRSGHCRCSDKKVMFWKGSGRTSQMASWRITGIFGNSGYLCAPKLFGPSALCNALVFCIWLSVLFCLNHKIVHVMGRRCRKTTSLASICVVCAAGWLRVMWPPGRSCSKEFLSCLWFFFLFLQHKHTKCWDTVF